MIKVDFTGAITEGTATTKLAGSVGFNPTTKIFYISTGSAWTANIGGAVNLLRWLQ